MLAFKEAHQRMVGNLPKPVQDLLTRVTQRQMTTSALVYEAKAYGSRVIKELRDELSTIQQKHVKDTNAAILDFEMEGRQQRDLNTMRREELLTEFKRVTQQLLQMRLQLEKANRQSSQLQVLMDAMPQCYVDMHLVALASLGNLVPVADAPDANQRLLSAVSEL